MLGKWGGGGNDGRRKVVNKGGEGSWGGSTPSPWNAENISRRRAQRKSERERAEEPVQLMHRMVKPPSDATSRGAHVRHRNRTGTANRCAAHAVIKRRSQGGATNQLPDLTRNMSAAGCMTQCCKQQLSSWKGATVPIRLGTLVGSSVRATPGPRSLP